MQLRCRQRGRKTRQQEPWTFGRLLGIRGFGAFSLLDLLAVLAEHVGPAPGSPR
jgi:hypothetical protein